MPVVKFDPNVANFLIQGDRRFFLMSLDNDLFLMRDNCPHRGGPLHLGSLDCKKGTIVCPWHEATVSIQRLQQHAVPCIRHRDMAVAVFPTVESTPIVAKRRQLLIAA
jgi:nitrite reductase (NADH) small subunit